MIGSIIEQLLLHLPLFFGAMISFSLLKVPDLSIETAYLSGAFFGSAVNLYCQHYSLGMQIIFGIGISLLTGFIVGCFSAFLTTFLRISHLLATIMTTGFFYTMNQMFFGSYLSLKTHQSLFFSQSFIQYPEMPFLLISTVVIFFLAAFFLRSNLGYFWIVYGLNKNFLMHYGVSKKIIFILGVAGANMFAGYSGYLQAQSNGFVEITMAMGKSLICLTVLILGKIVIVPRGYCMLLRPLLGGFFYFVLQFFLIRCGFNTIYFSAAQALIIAITLGLNRHITASDDDLGV